MDAARTDGVVAAAQHLVAVLDARRRALLLQPYTAERAERWSNFPQGYLGDRGRFGLPTGSLDPRQWAALLRLLAAATGGQESAGFRDLLDHLDADDVLVQRGAGSKYGRGRFFVALLGAPDARSLWQLQFGGHHLAVSNTYRGGGLVGATPAFRGMEPFPSFLADGRLREPERGLQRAAAALVASLTAPQRTAASSPAPRRDLLLGPGADWSFPTGRQGVAVADLSAESRQLVLAVLRGFVERMPAADAARILAGYAAELDRTAIAIAGSPGMRTPGDYLRIDGPGAWVEYSMHDGIVTSDPHPHAVWRDRRSDYGGSWRP